MSVVNFEVLAKRAEEEPKLQEAFKLLAGDFDPTTIYSTSGALARPFVPTIVWAIYSAIAAVTHYGIVKWTIVKTGVGMHDILDSAKIDDLLKAALPHWSEYLDKVGDSGHPYALDALDQRLIAELQKMANGTDDDQNSVAQAAAILKVADEIMAATSSADAGIAEAAPDINDQVKKAVSARSAAPGDA